MKSVIVSLVVNDKKRALELDQRRHEVILCEVKVTSTQFTDAIAEWNSPAFDVARATWAKHKKHKEVFWKGDRCYPPKHISRLATRAHVENLLPKLRKRYPLYKGHLDRGLAALTTKSMTASGGPGYELHESYSATEAFGFSKQEVDVATKQKYGA